MVNRTEASSGLTPQALAKIVTYDPETGLFYWACDIHCGANNRVFRKAGELAGGKSSGYLIVTINYKRFYAHRLAWFAIHGHWPESKLDHINLVRSDNRISNLRPATDLQNRSNTKTRAKSGFKGVIVPKHCPNRYIAQISVGGKTQYLGIFESAADAHLAYCAAAVASFGEFARFS